MARHDIRGLKLPDGNYVFAAKDVHNLNSNFIQLSQEIFGNSDFTKKVEKRVEEVEEGLVRVTETAEAFQIEVDGKLDTTTHQFTKEGYILKDSNGGTLITPNGIANEQNIGRVDNVQSGFPMRLPFHIGQEVSQINQAVLKWDISAFRTYSKGAATYSGVKTTPDGGARTSGDGGSYSKSYGVNGWVEGLAVGTSVVEPNALGVPHYHTISAAKLEHTHNISIPNHTHVTPDHNHTVDISHDHTPEFGILTKAVPDTWLNIWVDGANVYSVDAMRGEVDLSLWITTNGWHTLELRCWDMYRLDANLFLKTYIRR